MRDGFSGIIDWKVSCLCGAEYTPKAREKPSECFECGSTQIEARRLHDADR